MRVKKVRPEMHLQTLRIVVTFHGGVEEKLRVERTTHLAKGDMVGHLNKNGIG